MNPPLIGEVPEGWRFHARQATEVVYMTLLHQLNAYDEDQLRARVLAEAEEALGPLPSSEMYRSVSSQKVEQGYRHRIEYLLTAGHFRLVLDASRLDRNNPADREAFLFQVRQTIESEFQLWRLHDDSGNE